MAGRDWSEAVEIAVRRLVARTRSAEFTRQQMVKDELGRIVRETGSRGATPEMTLSRELQQMRDRGEIEFLTPGRYRLLDTPFSLPHVTPSKCVFVIGSSSIYANEPDRFYRFTPHWLGAAASSVGQWILFQEPHHAESRGFYAVARVEQIVRDPNDTTLFLALIEPGTYLEFGRDVPLQVEGTLAERGLLESDGRINNNRAAQLIRPISDEDFNRIVELGLIKEHELLPREDRHGFVQEQQEPFLGPIERTTTLVERKVRDRQFRKRVLDVYDRRCALTGMQLINGGGRAEAEAAHIMSVESGGPDTVTNGIALSGTVHWMFDRGMISLKDSGEILLSERSNDISGIEKLIYPDRRARLPESETLRPHRRYLAWHREYHNFSAGA